MATDQKTEKHFYVNWEELHRNAKALAWRVADRGKWKGIVAVMRSGLVPAALVARELEIFVIETVGFSGHRRREDPQRVSEVSIAKKPGGDVGDGAGWLVIDDLADTGRTLEVLRKLMPKAHFAALYAKPQAKPQVDTFITEVSQDTWIYFPWDTELQFMQGSPAPRRRNGDQPT